MYGVPVGARLLSLLLLAGVAATSGSTEPDDRFARDVLPVLERACVSCHDPEVAKGDLVLSELRTEAEAAARGAEFWDYLRERVVEEEMPPSREPRLSPSEQEALVGWIDSFLAEATPPRPVLRRLNDLEYENAIRDLFAIEFTARGRFPSDGISHGFATLGETLTLSTLELELYLEAAEEIATRIFVDDLERESTRSYAGDTLRARTQGATAEVPLTTGGAYRVTAEISSMEVDEVPLRVALFVDGDLAVEHEFTGGLEEGVQVFGRELLLDEGSHVVEVRLLDDGHRSHGADGVGFDPHVSAVKVVGPLRVPELSAYQVELGARVPAGHPARVRELARILARRVWRRPVTEDELDRLLAITTDRDPLEVRLRLTLTALLASPHFLFRIEQEELDDHALATRLAAFLWSSVPDERMDALADAGLLVGDTEVQQALVASMLEDPRVRGLADGFALPWLQVDALPVMRPDSELFPGWSGELAASMAEESALVFLDVVGGDASVWELVEATWTYVDERLASHYGLDGPTDGFERVDLASGHGVLAHAGVLTVTSEPTRTSPVKRGKWVLEVLLNDPPPPPPPGVDALDEEAEASMREQLQAHAENPDCASCHARMDPLGFGLEVFDAVGRLRESDGESIVDAVGTLPDGTRFEGPDGLVGVLRAEGRFPGAVLEKLFVYGLGRPLGAADRPMVEETLARLGSDPSLVDLIREVVASEPFQSVE